MSPGSTFEFLLEVFQVFWIPYAFACIFVIGWGMYGDARPPVRWRRAAIGWLWCTAMAIGVNFVFLDLPYRIGLFLILTFGGIGFGRFLDRIVES